MYGKMNDVSNTGAEGGHNYLLCTPRPSVVRPPDGAHAVRAVIAQAHQSGNGVFVRSGKPVLPAAGVAAQLSAARALVQKLAPRYAGQPPRQARGKLSQAIARKGFSWDVIASALECLPEDAGEFEE